MKRSARMLALGSVVTLGMMTIASGQDSSAEPGSEPAIESRVVALEETVARLNLLVQMRTDVSGPQDRISRDFNLDQRLDTIELAVQSLQRQLMDLERQTSSVANSVMQAQRDAQMALQMARDLSFRVN